jgi:hypothetical protein
MLGRANHLPIGGSIVSLIPRLFNQRLQDLLFA